MSIFHSFYVLIKNSFILRFNINPDPINAEPILVIDSSTMNASIFFKTLPPPMPYCFVNAFDSNFKRIRFSLTNQDGLSGVLLKTILKNTRKNNSQHILKVFCFRCPLYKPIMTIVLAVGVGHHH